jgi:MFS family permease
MMEKFKSIDIQIIALLAGIKLLIHFLFNGGYGYFRDEFYYLACGEHLDFGYVDQPPLIALLAKAMRILLGDSLFAIRFLPAVAGAATVFFTGLLVRQMGGKRPAIILACLAVITAPVYLAIGNFLSMNVFDQLFWTIGFYLVALLLTNEKRFYWLWLGIVIGLGFENKISILVMLFGTGVGMLLTPSRRWIATKNFWFAAAIAAVLALPHILWQIAKGFPTLEFMENATRYKNMPLSPLQFLLGQSMDVAMVGMLLVIAGIAFFFSSAGKHYRLFGWTYAAIFLLFIALRVKTYYIAPIYPLMCAGGGIFIEKLSARRMLKWITPAVAVLVTLIGVLTAPLSLPILSVESYQKYTSALGIKLQQAERGKQSPLPQHFADMFGWENMALRVARVYYSIPETDRAHCGIYAQNYGEAGAIDFFGKQLGLPAALCGHNSYWYWNEGIDSCTSLIIVGGNIEDHKNVFESVMIADVVDHPYAMPYERHLPIYVCRMPKIALKDLWSRVRHFM